MSVCLPRPVVLLPNPQPSALTLRPKTLSSISLRSLQALALSTPRSYVQADGAVAPDHWLEPRIVWEVKCADLSLSPIYPAARGLVSGQGWGRPSKGIQMGEWWSALPG